MNTFVGVVARGLLLWLGSFCAIVALDHGFGVDAAWYWWFLLGFGLALTAAAWETKVG